MTLCDLTLPTPEENLACDEGFLHMAEEGGGDELLRFWEPTCYFVVVGYGNQVNSEVNVDYCREHRIPILRRCTGGGTVLQGPGVLNYSLVLRADPASPCHSISAANRYILNRNSLALTKQLQLRVEMRGQTDLAVDGLKICGNAQRRSRNFLLFHGSFLLNMDLLLIEKTLRMPSKQPEYRESRSHSDFLMNLKTSAASIMTCLRLAWNATTPCEPLPVDSIARLVREKYRLKSWNLKC
ncbi:MAG TPA: lipoate--protein ligase family protein [Candidatus Dormibacteraeota bacterium]|nr:lipoate--protein ligase family protein [Candidatus Dormibacteraeota bacterium]